MGLVDLLNNQVAVTITGTGTESSAKFDRVIWKCKKCFKLASPFTNGGYAISNYLVYRGTSSGSETLLATLGVVLTYTDNGLTNAQSISTKFWLKIRKEMVHTLMKSMPLPMTIASAPQSFTAINGSAQFF